MSTTTAAVPSRVVVAPLDSTDQAIVASLRRDGRRSLAALGTDVALSGDAVRERLRRLNADGIVHVYGTVDPGLLGYRTLALLGLNVSAGAEQIAEELAEVSEFDLVGCTAGRFDLLIEAVCRDELHLLHTVDRHLRSRQDVVAVTSFNYLQVLKFEPSTGSSSETTAPQPELDPQDLAVIEVLRADGRASYRDIAAVTGLPYQTARRHAEALLDQEIVRPEAVVNRLVDGSTIVAGVGLRTSVPLSVIAPRLLSLSEIKVAVLTTGPFDLLLDVVCRDRRHLSALIGEVLPSIDGVDSSETMIYQRFLKLPQSWTGLVRPT